MAKKLKIESSREACLNKGVEALEAQNLIIYPTDTVYGVGADATSDEAVKKVYEAKSRPKDKPISVAVDSLSMAEKVADLDEEERKVMKNMFPGPLTLVAESKPYVSKSLTANTGKIGIRIPKHPVVLDLIEQFGKPITTTSANITGRKNPRTLGEAIDQLGGSVELAIDDGQLKEEGPSTVVEIVASDVKIIREGPIQRSDLKSIL